MDRITFGLSNAKIAFLENGEYEAPLAAPGARELSLDADGDETTFFADNGPWWSQKKNNGYTGSMEWAVIPDAIKARMLGDYIDTAGAYVEDADGKPTPFALITQIEGDEKNRGVVFYEVTASRPNIGAKTTEGSIEPSTETFDLRIVPRYFEDIEKKVVRRVCKEGDADWATFFTAVSLPKAPAENAGGSGSGDGE